MLNLQDNQTFFSYKQAKFIPIPNFDVSATIQNSVQDRIKT